MQNDDFKKIRHRSGMSRKEFGEYFEIPYRTVQNWELGLRECPEYLLKLMKYKLDTSKEIYLIGLDNSDEYHEVFQIKGYIVGTEKEAKEYCDTYNQTHDRKNGEMLYQLIDNLITK